MKYVGSKNRIAKFIIPIMCDSRIDGQCWVEPFVGGANSIDKVSGWRIGADIDCNVIEALTVIRDHVHKLPKDNIEFNECDYRELRSDASYEYKGYAGFAFSYGGKWLGGWRRDRSGLRDYVNEAYRNAVKQSPKLKGVKFICTDYRMLEIPERSLIYCDPPYAGTLQYRHKLNHNCFWDWCRVQSGEGYTVFVSSYTAPKGFECVYETKIVSSLTKNTGSKIGNEKLYMLRNNH